MPACIFSEGANGRRIRFLQASCFRPPALCEDSRTGNLPWDGHVREAELTASSAQGYRKLRESSRLPQHNLASCTRRCGDKRPRRALQIYFKIKNAYFFKKKKKGQPLHAAPESKFRILKPLRDSA